MGFYEDRINVYNDETIFQLKSPLFSGEYRWVATQFKHRMWKGSLGPNEELFYLYRGEKISTDPTFSLKGKTKDDKIIDLIENSDLPSVLDPSIYIEYNSVRRTGVSSKGEPENGDFTSSMQRDGSLTKYTSSLSSSDMYPSHSDWTKWWTDPTNSRTLPLYIGQASGAHHWGWEARGGKGLDCIPSNRRFRIFCDSRPPSSFSDIYADRAGFIILNIEKKVGGGWKRILQGDKDMLNPLALPLMLDNAELNLFEVVKGLKSKHPLHILTVNTHKVPGGLDSTFNTDMDTLSKTLVSFTNSGFSKWTMQFGKSLTGREW